MDYLRAPGKNFNADIYVYHVEEKKSWGIVVGPTDDYNPVFTPDGKRLVFLSEPTPSQVEIHSVSLLPEDKAPYEEADDEEGVDKEPKRREKKEGQEKLADQEEGKEEGEAPPPRVDIDFSEIQSRIRPVPLRPGLYRDLQVTSTHYYFLSPVPETQLDDSPRRPTMALYAFDLKELKSRKIVDEVVNYRIAAREKKLIFLDGKGFKILETIGKAGKPETISLAKVNLKVDRRAEWQQIFDEGWRMVRDYFYDPNMHGVNWLGVKEYYRSLLPYVRTREELNMLMVEMVGELNASHEGVTGGDDPQPVERYPVALLGAELVPDAGVACSGSRRFTRGTIPRNGSMPRSTPTTSRSGKGIICWL